MKVFLLSMTVSALFFSSLSLASEDKQCDQKNWSQEGYYFNGVKWDAGKSKSDKSNFPGPPSTNFNGKVTSQKDGKVLESWEIKAGKLTLYEKITERKNMLEERWTYKDGCAHGDIRTNIGSNYQMARYENGYQRGLQKAYEEETKKLVEEWTVGLDGKKGVSLSFDKFGNLKELNCDPPVTASPKHKELCGLNGKVSRVKEYDYENDKPYVRRELGFLNGKRHGIEKVFDEKGKVTSSVNFKNGAKDGTAKSSGVAYEGTGETSIPFVNGKREGKQVVNFRDSKTIQAEILWKNDEVVRHIEYYQNGKRKVLREYKGGKIHVTTYGNNGKRDSFAMVVPRSNWWGSYSVPDGKVIYYQEDGGKWYEANYESGEKNGTTSYFFSGSKKVSEKQVWKNGDMTSKTEYTKDGKIAKTTEFFPDGSKKVKTP